MLLLFVRRLSQGGENLLDTYRTSGLGSRAESILQHEVFGPSFDASKMAMRREERL